MATRSLQLLILLLSAVLSPLCCCQADVIAGFLLPTPAAETAEAEGFCPLCHPAKGAPKKEAPGKPCDQCPVCKGSNGTRPQPPVALRITLAWDVPVAVLAPERIETPSVQTECPVGAGLGTAVHRPGREVLRLRCALLV